MAGISQILETARRAMLAHQYGLAVTGHNIANAGTAGYSRQRVELSATAPLATQSGLLGTGVMVSSVSRLHERFIDQQIRSSGTSLGLATADYRILSQIEAMYNEPSDSSLSSVMTSFFESWQDLSTNPSDPTARNALMMQGKLVADTFRQLHSDMTGVRTSLRDDLTSKVDQINALTAEIGTLNGQITNALASGQTPSDLQDLRDTKLDALAGLANIQVHEDSRGCMTVSLGGNVIADNGYAETLKVAQGPAAVISGSSFDQLRIVTGQGMDVSITGGEAGGVLKSYNTAIPDALGRLDRLAEGLINEVNRLHATGYGLGNPPVTGINFFKGTDAETIGLDLTDTSGGAAAGSAPNADNIAASSLPSAAGNNDIALLIAGAFNRKPLTGAGGETLLDGLSLSQYYSVSVTRVATAVNAASTQAESQELVSIQLAAQRDSVSGVSVDEELTNMIKFQRAFDAAAKMVSTVDEMYQTLLNMV